MIQGGISRHFQNGGWLRERLNTWLGTFSLTFHFLGGCWGWKLSYKNSGPIRFQELPGWWMHWCAGKVANLEGAWKLSVPHPHSILCPMRLFCLAVPELLYPFIIKLVIISRALLLVLWVILKNYQIGGGGHGNPWICSQPGRIAGSLETWFVPGIWSVGILVRLRPLLMGFMLTLHIRIEWTCGTLTWLWRSGVWHHVFGVRQKPQTRQGKVEEDSSRETAGVKTLR